MGELDVRTRRLLILLFLLITYTRHSVQQVPNERRYIGCWVDDSDRILPDYSCVQGGDARCPDCAAFKENMAVGCQNSAMTVDLCLALCLDGGHTFAGVQAGNECYCGREDAVYNKLIEVEEGCDAPCEGDPSQECGGPFLARIYDLRKSCIIENADSFITPSEAVQFDGEPVVFDVGKTLSFTCQTGYTLSGPGQVTCQADGNFSPSIPTCTPPDTLSTAVCPALTSLANGAILPQQDTYREGETATFVCRPGYSVQGNHVLTCLATGEWDAGNAEPPTCEVIDSGVDCGTPPTIENAGWNLLSGETTVGSKVFYKCNEGFAATKEVSTLICDENQQTWVGTFPTCTQIMDTPDGGKNGGPDGGSGNVLVDQQPDTGGYLRGFDSLLWIIAIIIVVGITILLIGCIVVHTVSQDTAAKRRTNDNTMLVVPAADNQPPTNDHNQFGVTDDRNKVERNAV